MEVGAAAHTCWTYSGVYMEQFVPQHAQSAFLLFCVCCVSCSTLHVLHFTRSGPRSHFIPPSLHHYPPSPPTAGHPLTCLAPRAGRPHRGITLPIKNISASSHQRMTRPRFASDYLPTLFRPRPREAEAARVCESPEVQRTSSTNSPPQKP